MQWYFIESKQNLFEFDTVDGVVTNECGYLSKVSIFWDKRYCFDDPLHVLFFASSVTLDKEHLG